MDKTEAEKFVKEAGDEVKFVIRTTGEETKYIDNIENNAIKKRTGEMHTQQEEDIFAITGIKKTDGMKAYDYNKQELKRLVAEVTELKEKGSDKKTLEKIKELEGLLEVAKKGDGADAVRKLLEEEREDRSKEKEDYESKIKSSEVGTDISKGLSMLEFTEEIDKDIVNMYIKTVTQDLMQIAEKRDGKIVYLEDGEPILNKKLATAATSEYLLGQRLEKVLKTKKTVTGTGSENDPPDPKNMKLPPDVKTKDDLTIHLNKLGLTGKEKQDAYNELSKNL